jgi:glycosyltransferase involved in cell wall biosynthesis
MNSVGVVIPVRNRATLVGACLDSVRAQTLQPELTVVVDDGSTDDSPAVLRAYAKTWPGLKIVRTEPRGVSHARNIGIANCEKPLIAFLDSDDVWAADKLERQVTLFGPSGTQPGFVHCGCMQIDETGARLAGSRDLIPSRRGDVFEAMITEFYHVLGSASAVVARRDLLLEVNGFDETLRYGEDQDLWLKLARRSRLDYVADVLVSLRSHAGNTYDNALRRDAPGVLIDQLSIWNKWLGSFAMNEETLNELRRLVVAAVRARKRWLNLGLDLYMRLVRTRLPIVRLLFPTYLDFWTSLRDPRYK